LLAVVAVGTGLFGVLHRFLRARRAAWVLVPYAIADVTAIPREVREEIDVLAQFGPIAVGQRRVSMPCAGYPTGSATMLPSNR
jgi:hypothetical protein